MKKYCLVLAALFLFGSATLFAQNGEKKSSDKLSFSFSERFRMVMWDNAIDLDENGGVNQNFTRFRTSFGVKYAPDSKWEFNLKLTNEFRKYFTPSTADFHMNEIFLDQFNLKYKGTAGTLTLGRQNIFLGEGFVVLDGHPGDGSRSPYFNGIRYDWKINQNHTLTALAVYQPDEDFLPVINGKDIDKAFQGEDSYQLVEQSEQAGALYYNGNFDKTNLQSYFIYKKILDDGKKIVPESNIYTLGARVKLPVVNKLSFTGEGAYQFGDAGNFDRKAYGGYAYLSFTPERKELYIPKGINLGGFLLSGDDPSTPELEAWDPLFSRWPKWSESLIYTSLKENRGKVAYWNNMTAIYLQTNFNLGDGFGLDLNYYQLFAPEETNTTAFLSGDGTNRGGLIVSKLKYKISENVSGHIVWEHFNPGDFYFKGADEFDWARMEFLFKI